MKKIFILCLLLLSQNIFAQQISEIYCQASGKIDSIDKILVSYSDIAGMVSSVAYRNTKSGLTALLTESEGSLKDAKILVSQKDLAWRGEDFIYLEKANNLYYLVSYNQCSFYHNEESCSPNPPLIETAREVVNCSLRSDF